MSTTLKLITIVNLELTRGDILPVLLKERRWSFF